ncbi:MAG: hypothetical protein HOV94_04370, partial [Saccharothrix sp.]|nr:hypothetical protein [Saccharothrix sp.]
MTPRHLVVRGGRRADRQRLLADVLDGDAVVVAGCHARLRGPYTGVDTVLRAVLPEADPALVEAHRVELLYGIPELADLIGAPPPTLASAAPFAERTRFYGARMIRCMSQGVVTFLVEHARSRAGGPRLVFEDVHEAEATTLEFLALLVRRCPPEVARVVVCAGDGHLGDELEDVLAAHADEVTCTPGSAVVRSTEDPVRSYVDSDGTS